MFTLKKLTSSWAVAALVLICAASFGLMLWASQTDSAIVDEQAHIPAGYAYVSLLDYRLNPEHPPLVKALAMLPVEMFVRPTFPVTRSAWTSEVNSEWTVGYDFLYYSGNSANAIILSGPHHADPPYHIHHYPRVVSRAADHGKIMGAPARVPLWARSHRDRARALRDDGPRRGVRCRAFDHIFLTIRRQSILEEESLVRGDHVRHRPTHEVLDAAPRAALYFPRHRALVARRYSPMAHH